MQIGAMRLQEGFSTWAAPIGWAILTPPIPHK
jgi:hypothetical protein